MNNGQYFTRSYIIDLFFEELFWGIDLCRPAKNIFAKPKLKQNKRPLSPSLFVLHLVSSLAGHHSFCPELTDGGRVRLVVLFKL